MIQTIKIRANLAQIGVKVCLWNKRESASYVGFSGELPAPRPLNKEKLHKFRNNVRQLPGGNVFVVVEDFISVKTP